MWHSSPEMTSQAFELAHFIHSRRDVALTITRDAWDLLEAQLKKQKKRGYYVPLGRFLGGVKVKARTKVSFDDSQKLQSLVYLESKSVEMKQEAQWLKEARKNVPDETQSADSNQLDTFMLTPRSLPLTDDDWLIRFIKHLTSISTDLSSFYVTLAVTRGVFNYTTQEAVDIYYAIVPNEERWKDGQYFRKRRNEVVIKGLKERFGAVLQTRVVAHGEHRFKCRNDAERFAPLVEQCLEMFTPWNTECIHAGRWNPMDKRIEELGFTNDDPEKDHPIEARRMHTLIHPECFARLTTALNLATPNERLEVPIFFLNQTGADNHSGGGSGSRRKSPEPLTDEELAQLESALKKQRKRRKQARPDGVKVLIDGVESGKIRLDANPVRVRVNENARLIEIMSQDSGEALLLGSVLLDYRELSRSAQQEEYSLRLPRGRNISIRLLPLRDVDGEFAGADLEIELTTAHSFGGLAAAIGTFLQPTRAASRRPAFVFVALTILAGATTIALLVSRMQRPRQEYIAQIQPQASPAPLTGQQGGQSGERRSPVPTTEPSLSPPTNHSVNDKSKAEAAREGTRILSVASARELSALRRIYVVDSTPSVDMSVRAAFIEAVTGSSKVRVASESATDAYLYLDLTQLGAAKRLEGRLLSRNGIILWHASRTIEKSDEAANVARALGRDLARKLAQ
jgi:hypothetical protein